MIAYVALAGVGLILGLFKYRFGKLLFTNAPLGGTVGTHPAVVGARFGRHFKIISAGVGRKNLFACRKAAYYGFKIDASKLGKQFYALCSF